MAELDTTYRTARHRPGMDPNTRKLAMIAGGIGVALAVMVGAWSLTGGKSGGVPVIQADSRPLRVKPDSAQQAPDMDEPTDPAKQGLAPTPETPNPNALRAQAEKAAAEKRSAEKLVAEKMATEKMAAEKLAAERAQAEATQQAAAPPPARHAAPAASARPPAQPVALTSPIAPAPVATAPAPVAPAPVAAAPAARPAPASAQSASPPIAVTQVQLAAVHSEQAARSEWSRLEKRMPDVLNGRRPAVIKAERDGKTFWRLRTGGFADASQAGNFCDKVRAKGGVCSVASF